MEGSNQVRSESKKVSPETWQRIVLEVNFNELSNTGQHVKQI